MRDPAAAPVVSPIQSHLERLYLECRPLEDGEVATYIPELAKADPSWFGICLATIDGRVYEIGDTRQPFTIQSISKPFVYGLALEDRGRDAVLAKIGVEPTGDAFNSISLAPGTGSPLNPMINAGAIAAASLVSGRSQDDKIERVVSLLSLYAGRALGIDRAVYESESATGHRNRAIGHMLRNFDVLTGPPDDPLELYFQQCSVAVDCRDLARMAATLANGGVNPTTGDQPIRPEFVQHVLSVMATCGMYDYAGEWIYWVGMPAKSGVSGGVLAVLPGQLGLGVFSPRLDTRGNSVRGVEVCRRLARDLDLHVLTPARPSSTAVRASYSLARVGSKRVRSEAERETLDRSGERARVFELHGDLGFAAVETVARAIVDRPELDLVIVDLGRVTRIDDAAAAILLELFRGLSAAGKWLAFARSERHGRVVRDWEEQQSRDGGARVPVFAELDRAIEVCENRLLGRSDAARGATAVPVPLAENAALRGLSADALQTLEGRMERREYASGDAIVRRGEAADRVFFLTRGEVSVSAELPNGQQKRLSTLSPGTVFGELATVSRSPRSADVRADTAAECWELEVTALDALGEEHPAIKASLLENLLRSVARTAARLTDEVLALSR